MMEAFGWIVVVGLIVFVVAGLVVTLMRLAFRVAMVVVLAVIISTGVYYFLEGDGIDEQVSQLREAFESVESEIDWDVGVEDIIED